MSFHYNPYTVRLVCRQWSQMALDEMGLHSRCFTHSLQYMNYGIALWYEGGNYYRQRVTDGDRGFRNQYMNGLEHGNQYITFAHGGVDGMGLVEMTQYHMGKRHGFHVQFMAFTKPRIIDQSCILYIKYYIHGVEQYEGEDTLNPMYTFAHYDLAFLKMFRYGLDPIIQTIMPKIPYMSK